jgi:hypothetical protein
MPVCVDVWVDVSVSFLCFLPSIPVLYPLESAHQCCKQNILLILSLPSLLQETARTAETKLELTVLARICWEEEGCARIIVTTRQVDFEVLLVVTTRTTGHHVRAPSVSRWLSTAAARVRARVRSCGVCGGQCGTGAGFN